MTGVFISYSRKDTVIAHRLMEGFGSIDLDVWVDWEDIPPAVGWLNQILLGIEQADVFIFLISPDSIKSEVCHIELEHAHKNAKRIIPIVVRDANPKETVAIIRDLNWIFIREQDDFTAGLEKVQKAINLDVDWLHEHRRLQVRALDWDRRKDPSLLLRGSDLRTAVKMIAHYEDKDPKPSDLQKIFIDFSRRSERFRMLVWVSAASALVIMILLSVLALNQRQAALKNAREAQEQAQIAQKNETLAIENARAALAAKAAADTNAKIAQAQRSAARAQIYQSRAGGLFTSTLLAVDSYQRKPSAEAEGILRKNISLLPAPVMQMTQPGAILAIEVSPDGAAFISASDDGTACLIRFEGGESIFCSTSSGAVWDAAFSPDGKMIATSDVNGQVRILNAQNGDLIKQLNLGVAVRDVNISPDGRLLAMARDDGRITLIKLSNYEFAGEFSVFGSLRVTAFSPDGVWFAAGSNIGAITFWNLATGRIVSGSAHRGEVFDIAFSPDSLRLISGGSDNNAIMTSPSSGKKMIAVSNEDWVVDVAFSPDGAWFVTASNDFRIRVWDTKTGEERLRFLQDSLVNEVIVSPNGMWIASTGSDRTARVWSAVNGAEMFQIPLKDAGAELAFSADSAYLVAGDASGQVSIWDLSTLQTNVGYLRFDGFTGNVEVSPDGTWFAASAEGQVWILDPELFSSQTAPTGLPVIDLKPDIIYDLAIHPDGTFVAIATLEGKIFLLNRTTGRIKEIDSTGSARKIQFSNDGATLYLAGQDGILQYRGVNSSEAGILWQGDAAIDSLALSSNNQLALGIENRIVLLDAVSASSEVSIESPGKNQQIAYNPAGNLLASNSSSGRTTIWQRQNDRFEPFVEFASDQTGSLAFDPAGERLFLGETDQILVVDVATGSEINRIRQKGAVTSLAFTPDGDSLLASSLRAIQLMDLTATTDIFDTTIISAACNRLTQNFSEAEWIFFFEEEPFRKLCESLP
ncbi:MAG: TIR domain-containing protein [Chloroflexi bacterium]|nr:TIR domain-containing protein [Chloroflexota bacterium]